MSQELNLDALNQGMDLLSEIERWGKGPMFLSDTPRVKNVLLRALARIRDLERAQPAGEAVACAQCKPYRDATGELVAPLCRCKSAAPPAAANQAGIPDAEAELRRMRCYAYAGSKFYGDDGELQDNRERPFIDFKRDSVAEIKCKINERGNKRLAEWLAAGHQPTDSQKE